MSKQSTQISITSAQLGLLMVVIIIVSTLLSVIVVSTLFSDEPWIASEAPQTRLEQSAAEQPSWNSGMEALEMYQCRKAETKQIILGGIEDNYAPGGEADVVTTPMHSFVAKRIGPKGAVTVDRGYDEAGFDRFFLDTVEVPSAAKSGLFVIGARSLAKTNNDALNVGEIESKWRATHSTSYPFEKAKEYPNWIASRNVLAARLSDMTFLAGRFLESGEPEQRDYENLLDFIASSPEDTRSVDVLLGDDHIVDFFGIAVCLPPEQDMGLTLRAVAHQIDPAYVKFDCVDANGENSCDPHSGDTLCSAELPLACIKPGDEPIKQSFAKAKMHSKWTGGQVKFTQPIVGSSLANGAEAHAVCRGEFGDGFRAVTHQERAKSMQFLAKGSPPPASKAWVHAKTEHYANCWAIETDYKAATK